MSGHLAQGANQDHALQIVPVCKTEKNSGQSSAASKRYGIITLVSAAAFT
jgi:hypothetical protein